MIENRPHLRLIGGPNGSGKSTLKSYLENKFSFSLGQFINADEIQLLLETKGELSFDFYNIKIDEDYFNSFISSHPLNTNNYNQLLTLKNNQLTSEVSNGYIAAIIADLIRHCYLNKRKDFTFETVFSGKDKIDFLAESNEAGYKNYLYFVCTKNVAINYDRVSNRTLMGGHSVIADKISARYYKSLENIKASLPLMHRGYFFDNSSEEHKLIAEIKPDRSWQFYTEDLPNWFKKYVPYI